MLGSSFYDEVLRQHGVVNLAEAAAAFSRATAHCDNLVKVHRRAGTGGQGRRFIEVSVNRAVIVIAVACWQSVVQDLTKVLLDASMPAKGSPGWGTANLLAGRVSSEIGKFSTPNAENTRTLLQSAGFDARPSWTWSTGRFGRDTLTPTQVESRLAEWLKIRHAIAHGHEHMPCVGVLQAVTPKSQPQDPPIRLVDAIQCLNFVRRLAQVTADGVASHLGVPLETFH